jgi:predicted permease
MSRWRRFLAKLSNLFRRERAEKDLAREVAAHLALLEDEYRRRGMSPEEALYAAKRAYGSIEQAKELHRDERSFPWLEQSWQDVRHAWRSLSKSPGFVAVALLSLAFGIGVNTAIFTLVNGILLKQLPLPDAGRIVQLEGRVETPDRTFETSRFNFPVIRELRRQEMVFQDVIAFWARSAILEIGNEPVRVDLELVTGSYFSFFGTQPALGRLLNEDDDAVEGANPVCVISYEAWQTYFGGDPKVIEQAITIDGAMLRVVGVVPRGFVGPELQRSADVWAPTAIKSSILPGGRELAGMIWLAALARLKPGISFEEAAARLQAASPVIEAALPDERANKASVYQIRDASKGYDSWRKTLRDPLLILMGAVLLVLLVACANLTNLLLARMNDRRQEFAIKLALGISRWRLLRQLLVESLLVALAGGAAALLISVALTRLLLALFNAGSRYRTLEVAPDSTVFLYTLGTCVVTALIAGLFPAWQASRAGVHLGPRTMTHSRRQSYVRRSLVLVQVTLAVVLLFGAVLFAHSLGNLKTVDLGFDMDQVLTVEVGHRNRARKVEPEAAALVLDQLLARVRQLPSVERAAFSNPAILTGGMIASSFVITNTSGETTTLNNVHYLDAGVGYFSTLNMPLLQGRDFLETDRPGSPPVVIVNQQLASQAWPGENPIGKRVDGMGLKSAEVIGVVGNSKYTNVREDTKPIAFRAFAQSKTTWGALQIRFRGAPQPLERDIQTLVKSVAPNYQISHAATMEILRDSLIAQDRLLTFLSSLFGFLGTALALVGVYGMISYSVTRRTHEIGVRMSVGAQRGQVLWLFVRDAFMLLLFGVLLGTPLAVTLARLLEAMLYEVTASDPANISITVALLLLSGILAAYLPGRRATRVNPVQALRCD